MHIIAYQKKTYNIYLSITRRYRLIHFRNIAPHISRNVSFDAVEHTLKCADCESNIMRFVYHEHKLLTTGV